MAICLHVLVKLIPNVVIIVNIMTFFHSIKSIHLMKTKLKTIDYLLNSLN